MAKDDGVFLVQYYDKEQKINTKCPHIMSTEVTPYVVIITDAQSKRKGKRYEADEDKSETTQLEISAQIYAELLGQTLFGNWTDNPGKITHQEVASHIVISLIIGILNPCETFDLLHILLPIFSCLSSKVRSAWSQCRRSSRAEREDITPQVKAIQLYCYG